MSELYFSIFCLSQQAEKLAWLTEVADRKWYKCDRDYHRAAGYVSIKVAPGTNPVIVHRCNKSRGGCDTAE